MKLGGLGILMLSWALALAPASTCAETPRQRPLNVMVVLDNSGSMKKNDPEALMGKAVASFAAHLPAESRLGIVIFDERVRPALALTPASAPDFAARVAEALRGINYRGQWTDIPGGVERALYGLREQGATDSQRVLILFTDGVVETGSPSRDAERSRWLQDSLAAEAKQLGVRIFGIAFTEGADFRLLQSVAQTTGGEHYRVLAPAEIDGVFGRVRGRIQELADEEARKAAAAKAVPAGPVPAPVASTTAGVPWLWVLGLVLAGGAIVLVFLKLRSRPAVTGSLRDVGGYTGHEVHPLRRKLTRLGRDPAKNEIVIPQDTVSSQHAEIEIRGSTFYLKDLRSANGCFVNGRRISNPDELREVALKHGDRLRFDAFEFEFAIDGAAPAPAAASGAPVTPGGTRLRGDAGARLQPPSTDPAAPLPAVVAAAASLPDAMAQTRLKTGKCHVHSLWDAVAVCPQCGYEKCQQCMTHRDGSDICIDCATSGHGVSQ